MSLKLNTTRKDNEIYVLKLDTEIETGHIFSIVTNNSIIHLWHTFTAYYTTGIYLV